MSLIAKVSIIDRMLKVTIFIFYFRSLHFFFSWKGLIDTSMKKPTSYQLRFLFNQRGLLIAHTLYIDKPSYRGVAFISKRAHDIAVPSLPLGGALLF